MKGVAASGRTLIFDVSHDIENNGVSERKQCFSCKCHVFNIYFLSFYIVQEPLPSPSTSPHAPLCLRYRCYARFHKWL